MSHNTEAPRHESEMLAVAVEAYLAHRYPERTLFHICRGDVQEHDSQLARTLLNWRDAAGYPLPDIIGTRRCADCKEIMDDAPSACEDEDVCAKCAGAAHVA